jgi:drug/metabolite transporter (DMT)-like permease
MAAPSKHMSTSDWGLIVTLSLIWGSAFFLIVVVLKEVPPNTMVFMRLALAVPPMLLWLYLTGERMPMDSTNWRRFAILGALNIALPFILFAWGQVRLSSGLASVLNATTPLWGVLVAHYLTDDEKMTPARLGGVIIGFAGVAVMIGGGALTGFSDTLLAQMACVTATLLYALASIYAKRIGDEELSVMQIATGQVCVATVMMVPVVLLTEAPWAGPMPSAGTWAAMVTLSLVSTSLAYLLYFRLIASAGATNALLIPFLIPPVAILLGVLFLGETLTIGQLGGIGLIALGLAILDGRIIRRLAPAPSVP